MQQNDTNETDNIEPKLKKRLRLPTGYTVVAELEIDTTDWHRFDSLVGDTPATKIVAHDDPHDGWMTVYVGCATEEVRDRLEKGWQ